MESLPVELMTPILGAVIIPSPSIGIRTYSARQRDLSRVALVCKQWKNITFGIPELWALIEIGTSGYPSIRVGRHLQRAGQCLLDIVMMHSPGQLMRHEPSNPDWHLAVQTLKAHGHRWRSLLLSCQAGTEDLLLYTPKSLPKVVNIDVRFRDNHYYGPFLPQSIDAVVHAPKLRWLRTNCPTVVPKLQAPSLNDCKLIVGPTTHSIILPMLEFLGSRFTDLCTVEIDVTLSGYSNEIPSAGTVALPCLRILLLVGWRGDRIVSVLAHIDAPLLHFVVIRRTGTGRPSVNSLSPLDGNGRQLLVFEYLVIEVMGILNGLDFLRSWDILLDTASVALPSTGTAVMEGFRVQWV